MNRRWTMSELASMTDAQILAGVVTERVSGLNDLAPLARRLKEIRNRLDKGEPLGPAPETTEKQHVRKTSKRQPKGRV